MNEQNQNLPLGFAMALVQNGNAMENFSQLSSKQKADYISRAKQVNSKPEMQQLVESLVTKNSFY